MRNIDIVVFIRRFDLQLFAVIENSLLNNVCYITQRVVIFFLNPT